MQWSLGGKLNVGHVRSIILETRGVKDHFNIHSNLPNIMPLTTKVHVILRNYAMLTWMQDNKELVEHVIFWNNTTLMISYMGHELISPTCTRIKSSNFLRYVGS